jgi:hypothetical protein
VTLKTCTGKELANQQAACFPDKLYPTAAN